LNDTNIDILAFGAHPDDVECAAGGVVLSTTVSGGKVVIADLSRGEMGTFGDPVSRKQEAELASKILGLQDRIQLDMGDGRWEYRK
jgi:LmbE family N-acetylglucosaminyl deacetylase